MKNKIFRTIKLFVIYKVSIFVDNLVQRSIKNANPSTAYTGSVGSALGFKYICYQCGYKPETHETEQKNDIRRSFHSLIIHKNPTPIMKSLIGKFGWSWDGKLI